MTGSIAFSPILPVWALAAFAVAALSLLSVSALRDRRGLGWRVLAVAALVVVLFNPRTRSERLEARPDVALLIVDDTQSQAAAGRTARTEAALSAMRERLAREPDLEVREVRVPADPNGTRLVTALAHARALVPDGRFAGAVLITDGQVHDAKSVTGAMGGPVHVLLTGAQNERDRRVDIVQAPAYAITGKPVRVGFRISDPGAPDAAPVAVSISVNGVPLAGTPKAKVPSSVRPGTTASFMITPDRAGQLAVEVSVDAASGEVSSTNNRAAVTINAVRDRLKVLLISGQPHPGERTWRNLLKSDPSVDLVHFTILRPPEKDDFTPLSELSLIVFPVQELFERRLKEFDLVVFDRYVVSGILPSLYLANINDYVRGGGAMLIAAGPEFAGPGSLARTELAGVLPAVPNGRVIEKSYRTRLTRAGARHPVTAELGGKDDWGHWFRLVDVDLSAGDGHAPRVLLDGPGGAPVLVLDSVGKGRVAVLASDQIWLWARGYDGGGPSAELLRRLSHWLMKEPALEAEALTARVEGRRLIVERRSLERATGMATVTGPAGEVSEVALAPSGEGRARAEAAAADSGLYTVAMDGLAAMAVKGEANPLEIRDLRATAEPLAPLAARTGGGVFWLGESGKAMPDVRRVRPGRDAAGHFASGGGWMGLWRNGAHEVVGLADTALIPLPLLLLFAGAALVVAWWREGR